MFLDVFSLLCPSASYQHLLLLSSKQGADELGSGPGLRRFACIITFELSQRGPRLNYCRPSGRDSLFGKSAPFPTNPITAADSPSCNGWTSSPACMLRHSIAYTAANRSST